MTEFIHIEQHNAKTNTSKFYRVVIEGTNVLYNWGRCGAAGQAKLESFSTNSDAERAAGKKLTSKRNEGYRPVVRGGIPHVGLSRTKATTEMIAEVDKWVQKFAQLSHSLMLGNLQKTSGPASEVIGVNQWSEWGKGWEWMKDVKSYLLGVTHYISPEHDLYIGVINPGAKRELGLQGVEVWHVAGDGEDLDVMILETADKLWEPEVKSSGLNDLQSALETARLLV